MAPHALVGDGAKRDGGARVHKIDGAALALASISGDASGSGQNSSSLNAATLC